MEYIAAASIIAFAFWVKATMGFGSGLIAIPLLALFIDPTDAITLVLLFSCADIPLVIASRQFVRWSLLYKVALGAALGCVIGTLTHTFLSAEVVAKGLGVLVLFYVFKSRFKPSLGQALVPRLPSSLVGGLGGLLNGGFGMGGPIFVMYYKEFLTDKAAFRATLLATLFLTNALRIAVSIPAGLVTVNVLTFAMYAAIPFAAAIYIGQRYHAHIPEKTFRLGVDILLLISGVGLLV